MPSEKTVMSIKKILLLSLLSFLSCEEPLCEPGSDQTTGLAIQVLDRRYLAYDEKLGEDLGRNGIKITSSDQYRRVFAYCCANQLDSIDFSRYDLLGLTTVNKGSKSRYIRDVKQDETAKKITYSVSEEYCTRSSPVDGRSNFVLVPKLPAAYPIEYVRHQ